MMSRCNLGATPRRVRAKRRARLREANRNSNPDQHRSDEHEGKGGQSGPCVFTADTRRAARSATALNLDTDPRQVWTSALAAILIRALAWCAAAYRHCRHVAMLAAIALFARCATTYPLMPTPAVYVGQQGKPLFADVPAADKKASVDLLYVTHRAPGTEEAKALPYSAERSHAMAFGSLTVEFGAGLAWDTLAAQSTLS